MIRKRDDDDQGDHCIRKGDDDGEYISRLPPFQNYDEDNRITLHHQAIITSYKFECSNQLCGLNITEWSVDVHPDGRRYQAQNDNRKTTLGVPYTLDLQVWRPLPTVNDSTGIGCYSLVGINRFTAIPLNNGVASSLVPSSSNYIMFQPGDVLGVYVEEARDDDNGVVVLNRSTDFTSELVWYASIAPTMATSQNGDCPYSVGSNGVLSISTQATPVISISTDNSIKL